VRCFLPLLCFYRAESQRLNEMLRSRVVQEESFGACVLA